jgi:hypothetical protein
VSVPPGALLDVQRYGWWCRLRGHAVLQSERWPLRLCVTCTPAETLGWMTQRECEHWLRALATHGDAVSECDDVVNALYDLVAAWEHNELDYHYSADIHHVRRLWQAAKDALSVAPHQPATQETRDAVAGPSPVRRRS